MKVRISNKRNCINTLINKVSELNLDQPDERSDERCEDTQEIYTENKDSIVVKKSKTRVVKNQIKHDDQSVNQTHKERTEECNEECSNQFVKKYKKSSQNNIIKETTKNIVVQHSNSNNSVNNDRGWLYCLYNRCFVAYGNHVFKLGRTNCLKQRMRSYVTTYVDPSHFVCISQREFRNSRKAEAVLFYVLRRYRIREQREFFNVCVEQISHVMDRISCLSDDTIDDIYIDILRKCCPTEIIDKVLNHQIDLDEEEKWFYKSSSYLNWLDEYFEKYRFKPTNPEFYKNSGYREIEQIEIDTLIQNVYNNRSEFKNENNKFQKDEINTI